MNSQFPLLASRQSRRAPAPVSHLLRDDPWLAEAIAPAQLGRAMEECIASCARIPKGPWTGLASDALPGGIGLLVLDGLLLRRVGVEGRFGAELLGEGDLLRPWQPEDIHPSFTHTSGCRVLRPVTVAVLDRRVAYRLARYPELTGRLVARALERSRHLSVNMAIVHHPRIEVRLHMILWHLANRWGRVTRAGTFLPVRLTHTVLADLVAARRPTVTQALSHLSRRGLLITRDDGLLLCGRPPGELLELQDVSVPAAGEQAAETAAASAGRAA